jgi:hypothetical protein
MGADAAMREQMRRVVHGDVMNDRRLVARMATI